jgi:hypothetical protein
MSTCSSAWSGWDDFERNVSSIHHVMPFETFMVLEVKSGGERGVGKMKILGSGFVTWLSLGSADNMIHCMSLFQ